MIKKPSPLQTEIRSAVTTSRVELRAGADGTMPTLVGYAAVFDSRIDLGWFEEEVAVGAFTRSLTDGDDVRALYNHDSAQVIGRRDAKTLRLEEDATGLRIEIDLPDTTAAEDALVTLGKCHPPEAIGVVSGRREDLRSVATYQTNFARSF